ncbi:cation:proton antiporter [Actinosynnema sp. NPDC020468]|uniref:cation:proton antiporter n=1 Tax=Actinosynnema sp. NPDC020468 TaxID=3154488 RepID=UPI0033D4B27A
MAHVALVVLAVLLVAQAGRVAARVLGQPPVIGEIVVGLLLAPAVLLVGGEPALEVVLPDQVLDLVKVVADAGLALFLVGLAGETGARRTTGGARSVVWLTACSLVPALAVGAGLALWVTGLGDQGLRGEASAGSFVLFMAVATAITAVPVLARILVDRDLMSSDVGRLALTSAVTMDVVCYLLLSLALGLRAGSLLGAVREILAMAVAGVTAMLVRRVLRGDRITGFVATRPLAAAAAVAVGAIGAAVVSRQVGLTTIFGAVVAGFAVPVDREPWRRAVESVARFGRSLVPVFFVTAGMSTVAGGQGGVRWLPAVVIGVSAVLVKIGGGYLGSRLGGSPPASSWRVGVLMNTKGLTELVVLQLGLGAGIITGSLFVALLLMAVVATALTQPLLSLVDLVDRRRAVAGHS